MDHDLQHGNSGKLQDRYPRHISLQMRLLEARRILIFKFKMKSIERTIKSKDRYFH